MKTGSQRGKQARRVVATLPYAPDAAVLFSHLAGEPGAALLHSADRVLPYGRYDIMSAWPSWQCSYRDSALTLDSHRQSTAEPFAALSRQLPPPDPESALPGVPFTGGFIGFFGFALHQTLERHRPTPPDPARLPAMAGGWYDWALVTDHVNRTTLIYADSTARRDQVLGLLRRPPAAEPATLQLGAFQTTLSEPEYRRRFQRIHDYLRAGDVYQVNFARHFVAELQGSAWQLYRHWLPLQPAPFSAFFNLGNGAAVLSYSPERFLEHSDGLLRVAPIKGTRPRGSDAATDREQQRRLQDSSKDRAENLMIVDLLRNDLGRICTTGSVQVTDLFRTEQFSNVHHLVSLIEGRLQRDTHPLLAFARLFPSGSVTGAPKIRAIDIINELEPVGRSLYCGSIAYLDRSGHLDSSVAIRTAVCDSSGRVHLWGGGGLVFDSEPDQELREIQAKIGALLGRPS